MVQSRLAVLDFKTKVPMFRYVLILIGVITHFTQDVHSDNGVMNTSNADLSKGPTDARFHSETIIGEQNSENADNRGNSVAFSRQRRNVTTEATNQLAEECLLNQASLSADTVQRLLRQRRRISQLIKRVNKQQSMFCRPEADDQEHIPYRKCPAWRQEKLTHYNDLMRLLYCSDPEKWPNAPRTKRIFEQQVSSSEVDLI
ncbi:hypothetical protein DdX_06245 [Ditylenchus destructor]|uniref:Uncharacterized protein n=1 Tax=Ditylenchus destructor TaxID=166010 RepID=A0AAD4NC02_9BILA|nr:hypothetical protein DdX_06245 [Ditylenchus destructor]